MVVGARQFADITPVVVAEQQGDIVRHAHTLVIIILYFLVQRPGLGCSRWVFACDFCDDGALIGDDLFEESDVAAFRHRLVPVAPHADRDDAFVVVHVDDAFCPETVQHRCIRLVVPGTGAISFPFLLGPEHGLVVGGAHDDAIFGCEDGIFRVIIVEGITPHRRPEVIGFEAQQEFEHPLVKKVVKVAVFFMDPAAECGRFIIDEEAAVFYGRGTGLIYPVTAEEQ